MKSGCVGSDKRTVMMVSGTPVVEVLSCMHFGNKRGAIYYLGLKGEQLERNADMHDLK